MLSQLLLSVNSKNTTSFHRNLSNPRFVRKWPLLLWNIRNYLLIIEALRTFERWNQFLWVDVLDSDWRPFRGCVPLLCFLFSMTDELDIWEIILMGWFNFGIQNDLIKVILIFLEIMVILVFCSHLSQCLFYDLLLVDEFKLLDRDVVQDVRVVGWMAEELLHIDGFWVARTVPVDLLMSLLHFFLDWLTKISNLNVLSRSIWRLRMLNVLLQVIVFNVLLRVYFWKRLVLLTYSNSWSLRYILLCRLTLDWRSVWDLL